MKKSIAFLCLTALAMTAWSEPLIIPPLLEGENLKLYIREGVLELPTGTSKTMGFNGDYLGPTIRVSDSDFVNFNIKNDLGEDTTVHWHGLHVPAEYDGGPHQIIKAGETWNPKITIDQNAATLWYHPHLMGKTAEHVYKGLAGMFYIEDDYSRNLDIPQQYGVNDFPVILQDRRINRNGQFLYSPTMHDTMQGYVGNTVLTNGSVTPELEIPGGTYRLRLLNGSNSSILRIRFAKGKQFTVIASDGGFLPESVVRESIIISPGERYEILIYLESSETLEMISDVYGGDSYKTLNIKGSGTSRDYFNHPETFLYEKVSYNENSNTLRNFRMETRGMGGFSINGKHMDMNRIDFTLPANSTEVWTIVNAARGMMQLPHSFHVHDVQFSIISMNGKKPDPLYSGPKDTVLLMPGDEVVIALRFEDYTGIYMYHCHFLEHEDRGMMGQFLIE